MHYSKIDWKWKIIRWGRKKFNDQINIIEILKMQLSSIKKKIWKIYIVYFENFHNFGCSLFTFFRPIMITYMFLVEFEEFYYRVKKFHHLWTFKRLKENLLHHWLAWIFDTEVELFIKNISSKSRTRLTSLLLYQ